MLSGTIRDNTIDEIKSRCNIVDIVGRVVPLKRTGTNYKGLCPFHNEKTPSFVVSEGKQIFTCFGCGASGDTIEFMQKYYNLEFSEAVEKLAAECGVVIETDFKKSEKKDVQYQINREAATYFYKAFREKANPAASYMQKRGITPEVLNLFGIGYADGEWDSLYQHLKSKGYDEEKLMDLGLISESKGKYYDKFRNRVIFPIISTGGKVIGFGGRSLGDDMPKYLNSQESSVFSKKNNLYALNLTKQEIGKLGYGILVEGYMDVISLYQHGVRNVAASLGTALTENQARLLKRYTGQVVLSYDADEAGKNAALRGMEILHKENFRIKVLSVPDGKDPDDYIKRHGKSGFLQIIKTALPYADYKLALARAGKNMASTEDRLGFLREAVAILRILSPMEADLYIKKLAAESGISEGAIRAELGRGKLEKGAQYESRETEKPMDSTISKLEQNAIMLVLTESGYLDKLKPYEEMFNSRPGRNIFEVLKKMTEGDKPLHPERVREQLEPSEQTVLQNIVENIRLAGKEELIFAECIKTYEEERLFKKQHDIILRISLADELENPEEIRKLTEELMEIQKKLGGTKK
jgi:DNA primase